MYTIRLNSAGGVFKSALTGKAYEFKKTRDNSDRNRAHSEMLAADETVRKAAHARIGRAVTDIELLRYASPDNRSFRERAQADTVHRSNSPIGDDHNHYLDRVTQLREQLARESRASRREAIEKRLQLAESESQRFEQKVEAKRDWESRINHPDCQTAKILADSWRALLRSSHDPELQSCLERCEAAIAHLGDTADHASCRATLAEIESQYDAIKSGRAASLEQAARELRQEAKAVRAEGDTKPEPELEQTVE